jgi:lysozyme family protein
MATKYGITLDVAREAGYGGPMKDLDEMRAREIYRKMYWDRMNLDTISVWSYPLALELFDSGVNCGVGQAGKWLQRSLNVLNNEEKYWPDLSTDGAIGKKTLETLSALYTRRGDRGMLNLLKLVNCLQGVFYLELAERRKKDERFIYGWLDKRV